jgi:ferrochelatase
MQISDPKPSMSDSTYRHGAIPRTGVLLINLGTPEAPTPQAVRRFLAEFLSDPRVIELPRALWALVLHGIVLNVRPRRSAHRYAAIWLKEGSPLKVYTERQATLLRGLLGERIKSPLTVRYAMRYGTPAIRDVLAELRREGCERVLVMPLYPQYAASTSAAAMDEVFAACRSYRNMPELRFVKHFHDHPAYIDALGTSVDAYWREHGHPEILLMSFHGLPQAALERGDPYHCECQKTARLLAENLHLDGGKWQIAFQSRFGRAKWLQPYTAATLTALAKRGVKRVDLVCPGFVSDCLETLEELGIEGRRTFMAAGGRELHLIPCLNDRPEWIAALATIALEQLGSWVSERWDRVAAENAARLSAERARASGAAG